MKPDNHLTTDLKGAIRQLDFVLNDAEMNWQERHMRMQFAASIIDRVAIAYNNAHIGVTHPDKMGPS